jgi:hypothetical protein
MGVLIFLLLLTSFAAAAGSVIAALDSFMEEFYGFTFIFLCLVAMNLWNVERLTKAFF